MLGLGPCKNLTTLLLLLPFEEQTITNEQLTLPSPYEYRTSPVIKTKPPFNVQLTFLHVRFSNGNLINWPKQTTATRKCLNIFPIDGYYKFSHWLHIHCLFFKVVVIQLYINEIFNDLTLPILNTHYIFSFLELGSLLSTMLGTFRGCCRALLVY